MKNAINAFGIFLGSLSIIIAIALSILLISSVLMPGLVHFNFDDPIILSLICAVLFFISAIAFTLSSLGSNLMIMASSKEKSQGIIRILTILFISPILVQLLVLPFLIVVFLSFIYGDFARFVTVIIIPSADAASVSSIVSFFVISEVLYAAYRYNLFNWYLSEKKESSINLAESQFQVVYKSLGGIWKYGADIVRISFRATAFAFVMIILWSAISFSGVMQVDLSIGNLPTILIAGIFGIIPIFLIKGIKIKSKNQE